MKDFSKKKNIVLASILNTSKDNINSERSLIRRSTLVPNKNIKALLEAPSLKKLPSERKNDTFAEMSSSIEEKRHFSVFNTTHPEAFHHDGTKTSQIKVVARFRPINFVEDVIQ